MAYRLRHIDPDSNRYRWYVIGIQTNLFGEFVVVREYGRIGQPGTLRRTSCATEMEALGLLAKLHRQKLRKGYVPLQERPMGQLDLFG